MTNSKVRDSWNQDNNSIDGKVSRKPEGIDSSEATLLERGAGGSTLAAEVI